MQKYVPLVKQNVIKLILGGQRIDQKRKLIRRERRDGEGGEERGSRKGAERG